jgi:hypothetical protein
MSSITPPEGDKPTPNAGEAVMQFILLIVSVACIIYGIKAFLI